MGAGSPVLASVTVSDLRKIIDLVRGHRQLEHVTLDLRGPLEVGDPIAVHDHAPQRSARVHIAGLASAADQEKREKKQRFSHGSP